MNKRNCWEFKNCGNHKYGEAGGSPCQVPNMTMYDGVNGGKNGGRVCWIITDSACDGDVQVTFHHKLETCAACDFYRTVKEEEGGTRVFPSMCFETYAPPQEAAQLTGSQGRVAAQDSTATSPGR